ncbi:hypothetical protein [Nostoc sp. C052]|uniref:hypothetical protein n=1 Tax=Nostoc sp. C052 TaxID=2576902 RepID=UPI0015C354BF|nr:hypothetical protein [Nostoc sp. C052]
MNNTNLFSQTYDQIIKGILGGGKPYFQMLGTPKSFYWDVAPIGQIDPQAYQIMSGMPEWSPVSDFAYADANFFQTYRDILSHVTFKLTPDEEQDFKELQNQLTIAGNAVTKANSDMNQAYLGAKQNGGVVFAAKYPTINDWIASDQGTAWQHGVDNAVANKNRVQDLILELQQASMPATLQDAIKATKLPDGEPGLVPAPRGWTKVPDGAGILRWQPDWKIETSGRDWRAQLTRGSQGSFTVNLNASDSTSSLQNSWAGGTAGYNTFFWGVSGSGGWSNMDLSESDKNVKATISVKSSTTVEITPGDWYDGGFMRDLAKGGGQGYTIAAPFHPTGGDHALFGKGGILSTRIASLVIAYQPSYSITMSNSTYDKNVQKFNGSAGLRIGPFQFGGSGGHETEYTHSTSGGTTFTGASTSDYPVIIGALIAFPGVDVDEEKREKVRSKSHSHSHS